MSYLSQTEFDDAIERNRLALARIIAGLCAMIGFGLDCVPAQISRELKSKILTVLRPAESAARRLVFAVMKSMPVCLAPLRDREAIRREEVGKTAQTPPFQLFDTAKRFDIGTARKFTNNPPHIRFLHVENQVFNGAQNCRVQSSHTASVHVITRLKALQTALADLPKQAVQMARGIARRTRLNGQNKLALFTQTTPLRPGYPPGHRSRKIHEVDGILGTCAWLAQQAQAP